MLRTLLVSALIVTGCGDNGNQAPADAHNIDAPTIDAPSGSEDVTLRFTPQVGNQPFVCGSTYTNMGAEATTITPRDFRFYVHDINLIREDGMHVPLALAQDGAWQYQNLAMLDFEDFTGGCMDGTPETNMVVHGTIANAHYTGIAFTVGVPEAMNHVDLTTQPSPMNYTSLWWGWGFGHIFFAAVSHADITTPIPGTNDHYVHVGSIGCTGDPSMGETVTCTHPNRPYIELDGFDPTKQAIIADYGAVLASSNLTSSPGCHSMTEDTCAYPFDYVGLNWYTGSQTPTTQKVFRIAP